MRGERGREPHRGEVRREEMREWRGDGGEGDSQPKRLLLYHLSDDLTSA